MLLGNRNLRNDNWDIIIFSIQVAIVVPYSVRLPLLDRKDLLGSRDISDNIKEMK